MNPYQFSGTVTGTAFFGRQDMIDWVRRHAEKALHRQLAVYGQRRIGKTCLLRKLSEELSADGFVPVIVDLAGWGREALREFLIHLAKTIAVRMSLSGPKRDAFSGNGVSDFFDFMEQIEEEIAAPARMILLFDEIENMSAESGVTYGSEAAILHFSDFMVRLLRRHSFISCVYTSGVPFSDLAQDVVRNLENALGRDLAGLEEPAAKALIRQGENDRGLRFDGESVELLMNATNCHPFLLQLLCYTLWEHHRNGRLLRSQITPQEVLFATDEALWTGDLAFESIWKSLHTEEVIYIAAMAANVQEREGSSNILPKDGAWVLHRDVMMKIAEHAPGRMSQALENAPMKLVQRGYLEKRPDKNRSYRIGNEMLRIWIAVKKPMERIEEDFESLAEDPFISNRFIDGKRAMEREEWVPASKIFSDILRSDPTHLHAKLLYGENLTKRGFLREAVNTFRDAYDQDRGRSRFQYAGALANYAESLRNSDESRALELCKTAFGVSKDDPRVWRVYGEIMGARAQKAGQLGHAVTYFRKANDRDRAAEVQNLLYSRENAGRDALDKAKHLSTSTRQVARYFRDAAQLSRGEEAPGIWWGGFSIFRAETANIARFVGIVQALTEENERQAASLFNDIETVLPKDMIKDTQAIMRAGVRRSKTTVSSDPSKESASRRRYISTIESTEQALGSWQKALQMAALSCNQRILRLYSPRSAPLWQRAVDLLRKWIANSENYVLGLKQLRNGEFRDARRNFGWAVSPRSH